jgi:chromosome transmission fidelity protein 4
VRLPPPVPPRLIANVRPTGELGSVFSCPSNGDSPSIIHYRPEESWTSVAEWTYSLPPRENATVLAVGGIEEPLEYGDVGIAGTGTVLVATDKGFVRFLSGSGLQKYVWNLGEEVVSMAAGKDWAMVVWRAGAAVEGRQNLEYSVVDTDTFEMVQQGRLPLGKGATVLWVGMTNDQVSILFFFP